MGSTESIGSDKESAEMVKPNCTITERQNKLLDKLANKNRYASRSEALRAAIEQHYESLSEEGEDHFERILSQFEQISSKLEKIEEKIVDDHNSWPSSNPSRQKPLNSDGNSAGVDTAVTLEQGQEPVSAEIEENIYSALSVKTSKEISSVAAEAGESELVARKALESLVDRGWVAIANQEKEGELAYRITE